MLKTIVVAGLCCWGLARPAYAEIQLIEVEPEPDKAEKPVGINVPPPTDGVGMEAPKVLLSCLR